MSKSRRNGNVQFGHQPIFPRSGEQGTHNNHASFRKSEVRQGFMDPLPPPSPNEKNGAKTTTRPGLKAAANAANFIRNS